MAHAQLGYSNSRLCSMVLRFPEVQLCHHVVWSEKWKLKLQFNAVHELQSYLLKQIKKETEMKFPIYWSIHRNSILSTRSTTLCISNGHLYQYSVDLQDLFLNWERFHEKYIAWWTNSPMNPFAGLGMVQIMTIYNLQHILVYRQLGINIQRKEPRIH